MTKPALVEDLDIGAEDGQGVELSARQCNALAAYIRSLESTVEQQTNTLAGLKVGLPPHVPQASTELIAFIGRLEAEVAALKQPVAGETEFRHTLNAYVSARDEGEDFRPQLERVYSLHRTALRDAGRWQWLRDKQAYVGIHPHYRDLPLKQRTGWTIRLVPVTSEGTFDAAIDAVIQEEKGNG